MNAKLSKQRFWQCHENGLMETGLGAFRGVFDRRCSFAWSWVQLVKSAGSQVQFPLVHFSRVHRQVSALFVSALLRVHRARLFDVHNQAFDRSKVDIKLSSYL